MHVDSRLLWLGLLVQNNEQANHNKEELIFMFTRLILAAAVAFFLAPAVPVRAQEHEHPEHPKAKESKEHPAKGTAEKKRLRTPDILGGIKKKFAPKTKKAKEEKYKGNNAA